MTINTRVFKVDSSCTVGANNDLQFIIPSIGARYRFEPFVELVRSTEHVVAEFGSVCGFRIVHTDDEQGGIDDFEALAVVRIFSRRCSRYMDQIGRFSVVKMPPIPWRRLRS